MSKIQSFSSMGLGMAWLNFSCSSSRRMLKDFWPKTQRRVGSCGHLTVLWITLYLSARNLDFTLKVDSSISDKYGP